MRFSKFLVLLVALSVALTASAFAQDAPTAPAKRVVPSPPMTPKAIPASPAFGTQNDHYVRIGGSEFIPDPDSATFANTWNPPGSLNWRSFFSTAGFQHAYGWAHNPGGSALDYVELDYCNTDPTVGHDLIMNVYDCGYLGDCNGTPIATVTGAANSGCSSSATTLGPVTVDNYLHEYLLDVVWPAGGLTDSSINLAGAITGWKYQVSPAPATQTFNDVAPADFGYQFIEALAASGITGGCGGGNYCPNANLTRAQMAIFLSKALGLYWGPFGQ
jgi:hypothetical protein